MATEQKEAVAPANIERTGSKLQIERVLKHLSENLDKIHGLVLNVDFYETVKEPEGSNDPRHGGGCEGYTVSMDCSDMSQDGILGCQITTQTLGQVERIKHMVCLRRSPFG